jgi:hypothetical protein
MPRRTDHRSEVWLGVARVSRPVGTFSEVGRLLAGAIQKRDPCDRLWALSLSNGQARGARTACGIGLFRHFRSSLLAGVLVLGAVAPGRAAPVDEGWSLLAGYLFHDAYESFTRAPAAPDRMRTLGAAASLLNDSPVSAGKVEQVEAQLRGLVAASPADEPALYARYLLARIAHLHRPAEGAEIESAYRAVIAAAPGHPLAQLAAGKLALLILYQRPDLAVPQRLAAADALAPVAGGAPLPETACAYYRALADAALFYDVLDERVLAWLQRADAIGTRDVVTATGLRIQLAEVARALGHREEALGYYRQFLATAVPTDNRYRTAAERMAELAKEAP